MSLKIGNSVRQGPNLVALRPKGCTVASGADHRAGCFLLASTPVEQANNRKLGTIAYTRKLAKKIGKTGI